MFRYHHLLAALLLAAPAAFAQAPESTPLPQAAPAHPRKTFRDRFEAANTTHDGRLTLDQAQAANMHGVAQHFTEMDADKKGYITLQDVRAWHLAHRAARAGGSATPPPPAAQPPQ